ncbi:MFS transporter [Sphingobium algorifonticola]|uniref:MFS transporter n=1 Tax=Sphingobium algorifonticola TaxID=2008318 RepID=A0A437JDN4_9SPHN|nr:MFS transporter [Sphingobium algorifonticola]RVT43800.1 MFS transporter [Sphingobium algorifonticola]
MLSPASPIAPASGPARHIGLVLFALAMGGFAIGTAEFAAMSLIPYFASDLGVDAPTAGHVISAYALGVVVGAPILAILGARQSRRTLLIGLMAWFAVANAISALAPGYGWLLVFRFLSGVPHGAYFGVAALVAAGLVPHNRRTQAVSRVMAGLTVATVVGVPAANLLGQWFGWRAGFAIVAGLALVTVALVWALAPHDRPDPDASPLRELGALKRRQVWLTLATGAIGFGGIFALFTYIASTMLEVTGATPAQVPVVLLIIGIGMNIGNLGGAWAADKAMLPTGFGLMLWTALALAAFPFAAGNLVALSVVGFLVGIGSGFGVVLQTRLMDVAGDAQTLAASLHHSAFNVANALGPWLGGLAIAAGYGWTSVGWVGAALALGGIAIFAIAVADQRLTQRRRQPLLA